MKQITDVSYVFSAIREQNAVYVDKTAWFYRLVKNPLRNLFFISRPRRFGKTLMLSTLQSIFEGRKDLFEGLAISKTDYDWKTYPVIRLDFSGVDVSTAEKAEARIGRIVRTALRLAGYESDPSADPASALEEGILALYARYPQGVVVLVDEYDGPVGEAFDDLKKAEKIRALLALIYDQLKRNLPYLRFAMLTGVTRFTNLSIFSKLNNLADLTLLPEYAAMLGYTEEELIANFSEQMHAHAQKMGLSDEDYLTQLRTWYDGYRFSALSEARVYNPIAIAKTLIAQAPYFAATWAETGRPTIVAKFAKRQQLPSLVDQTLNPVSLSEITTSAIERIDALSLLYQTGYLTIGEVRQKDEVTLRVPNEEVQRDYSSFILSLSLGEENYNSISKNVRSALAKHDFELLFTQLRSLYATLLVGPQKDKIPEGFYQAELQAFFLALDFNVSVNVPAAEGFIDLVLETIDGTFIFELKRSYNGTAQDAIAQIREKHYAEPYIAKGRPIYLIGLVFDDTTHLLSEALAEPYTQA